jgi:cytochrome c oxidase assembly protein subunit 15
MLEHRFAKLCAVATFLLLVIGGTVNPTGSSLACPEPTFVCNGELFPAMTGGVFYEHGHRLVAELVGLLQVILTVILLRRRKDLRMFAWLALGMVAVQGLLGALTVHYKLPWYISTGHLLLAMTYFATLVYVAFRTRPEPTLVELDTHRMRQLELGTARRWIAIACGAILIQLLLGALVRHLGAALVCLGMPTCTIGGEWIPDTSVQQLHMLHRAVGVVVAIITTIAAIQVWRHARSWTRLRMMMLAAPILVAAQITLGILTVLTFRSVPIAVAHFAGAAGMWGLWASAWYLTGERVLRRAAAPFGSAQGDRGKARAMPHGVIP